MKQPVSLHRATIGVIIWVAFFVSGPGLAQEPARKTYRLSLSEVTRIALENSFDIQLAKYDTWIARTDRQVAESIYDTVFEAEAEYRNNQSQRTSTILGAKEVDNDYNVGLSKKLPTGTTISVDLENNRNSNNAAFATSPLTHDSALGVTVEQDLGKNILGIQDRGDVQMTLKDIENTEFTTLRRIEEHVQEVQKAYWDLVRQMENVKIEEAMVAEAKKLFDLHQEKLQDGLVEVGEAIASEANYESRKNDLVLARNQAAAQNNTLRLLLNIEDEVEIEPADQFDLPEIYEELLPALERAFANRQDYHKARNEIEARDIKLAMKKNNLWPEVNVTATLERNGLGDHFKQAVTRVTDEDNPHFFAGLAVTFPLDNNEAKGELKAAELEKAKAIVQLKLVERQIAVAVADQVRDCNVFRESAANRRRIALLQEQKLAEEQKRFKLGRSDTDTLVRFQEDVVQAQSGVADALYRYHAALVDLRETEGVLLQGYFEGKL